MDNLLSYGTNIQAWIELFSIFVIVMIGFWWFKAIRRVWKSKRKKLSTAVYVRGIIFFVCGTFLFFAFGSPIKPDQHRIDEESGMILLVDEMPDEKEKEVIEAESYEKKEEFLKRQDERGFDKEREEADSYIEKALKKAKERDGE
jgi:hypothetical protein